MAFSADQHPPSSPLPARRRVYVFESTGVVGVDDLAHITQLLCKASVNIRQIAMNTPMKAAVGKNTCPQLLLAFETEDEALGEGLMASLHACCPCPDSVSL